MQKILYFLSLLFIALSGFGQSPLRNAATPGSKVSFGNDQRHINFFPNSNLNNNYMIQPVGNNDSSGVSTSFYLSDSSSWSFYTNDSLRLKIAGNGNIQLGKGLVLNDSITDKKNILRVNGTARFDSSLLVQNRSDSTSFISIENRVKRYRLDPNDNYSAFTNINTSWTNGKPLPAFRVRHPKNVSNLEGGYLSTKRDFLILPYEFGMAIEYTGVVECWVGEWSIHKGVNYVDVEGNGNGWGGVLWVGDDQDLGGVRATARDNRHRGGNINYGELSVEKFSGASHGDFRFRLPSKEDQFEFVYGKRGSDTTSAKIKRFGIVPPVVRSLDSIGTPEAGQVLFNLPDSNMQYFNGRKWIPLTEKRKGSTTESSNGNYSTYKIVHTLGTTPAYFMAQATSQDAANINYITADNQYIYIHYVNPPPSGRSNLSWVWTAEK